MPYEPINPRQTVWLHLILSLALGGSQAWPSP
jgi:hypothetical protein